MANGMGAAGRAGASAGVEDAIRTCGATAVPDHFTKTLEGDRAGLAAEPSPDGVVKAFIGGTEDLANQWSGLSANEKLKYVDAVLVEAEQLKNYPSETAVLEAQQLDTPPYLQPTINRIPSDEMAVLLVDSLQNDHDLLDDRIQAELLQQLQSFESLTLAHTLSYRQPAINRTRSDESAEQLRTRRRRLKPNNWILCRIFSPLSTAFRRMSWLCCWSTADTRSHRQPAINRTRSDESALLEVERYQKEQELRDERSAVKDLIDFVWKAVEETPDEVDAYIEAQSNRRDHEKEEFDDASFLVRCSTLEGKQLEMQVSQNTTVEGLRGMIAHEIQKTSHCLHLASPSGVLLRPFTSQLGKHDIADSCEINIVILPTDELDTRFDSVYFPMTTLSQDVKRELSRFKKQLSRQCTRQLLERVCKSYERALEVFGEGGKRSRRQLHMDLVKACDIDDLAWLRAREQADACDLQQRLDRCMQFSLPSEFKKELAQELVYDRVMQLRSDNELGLKISFNGARRQQHAPSMQVKDMSIGARRYKWREMQNRNFGWND